MNDDNMVSVRLMDGPRQGEVVKVSRDCTTVIMPEKIVDNFSINDVFDQTKVVKSYPYKVVRMRRNFAEWYEGYLK